MRYECSKTAVTASLIASVTTRLFYGLTLDAPEAANAAWLAAPAGLALALPVLWLLCRLDRAALRALAAPLFVGIALDAAGTVEWTAYSESRLAFDHISPVLMMLPLLLAILRCAQLGGDAVGGAARIWIRLFAALMLVVTLYQLPYYNAGWLRPWLGAGSGGLLRAGVRAAGWIVLLSGSAIAVCEDDLTARDILPGLLLAVGVAALLVVLRQMMAPTLTGAIGNRTAVGGRTTVGGRATAVDALLTNGRAPLYLQLPMIVAWFAGMLHLMAFEGVSACALAHRLLPRAREGVCLAAGLGITCALALTRTPCAPYLRQSLPYLYHALAAATLLLWLIRRRSSKCAPSA